MLLHSQLPFLHLILKASIEQFIQSCLIRPFMVVSLFTRKFLPTLSRDVSIIVINSFLLLKFYWSFRSIQSSRSLPLLYSLYNSMQCLYFMIFIGVAPLLITCKVSNDVQSIGLHNLNDSLDADSNFCLREAFNVGINHYSKVLNSNQR